MSIQLGQNNIDKMTEYGIPEYMQDGLIRYFENRIPPGHFLTAVLENALMEAFIHADDTNQHCMKSYVMWLYNCAPMRSHGAWGSREAVKKWLDGENK